MYEIQQLPSLRARGTVYKTWNCINFYWHLLKVLTIFQALFPSNMYQLINSLATLFCRWENQSVLNKVIQQYRADSVWKFSHLTPVYTPSNWTWLWWFYIFFFSSAKTHVTEFTSLADSLSTASFILWFPLVSLLYHHILSLSTMPMSKQMGQDASIRR